jgi:hypothetical protein
MAQNTLLQTPANSEVLLWIGRHADSINKTASVLRIPASAIALGPAEEASHIISVDRSGARQHFVDSAQDKIASLSDFLIYRDYAERKMDIAVGAKPSYALSDNYKLGKRIDATVFGEKIKNVGETIDAGVAAANKARQYLLHPTKNDVGWGNVNVGVAIFLLDEYLIRTAKGEVFEGDPLDLGKYKGRYKALVSDLIDSKSDLTFKIAGLAVRRSDAAFADGYGDQYLLLPEKDRVALLVTGYKQGWQLIGRNLEINEVTNGGRPVLSDPKIGDGAPFALRNFDAISGALATGRRKASSLLLAPSASMDRATSQVLSDGQAPSSSPSAPPLHPLLISPMAGLFRARMSHGSFASLTPACQTPSRQLCPNTTTREFRRAVIGCAIPTRRPALPGMTSMDRRPAGCRFPTRPRMAPRNPPRERLRSPLSSALGFPVIRQFRSIGARRPHILVLIQRLQEGSKMLPVMTS